MSRQPFDRRVSERRSADRMDRRTEESRERRAAERRRGAGRRDLDTLLDVTRRLMTVTNLDALLRLIAEAGSAGGPNEGTRGDPAARTAGSASVDAAPGAGTSTPSST